MKAKEYSKQYLDYPTQEQLGKIIDSFLKEIYNLCNLRKCQSTLAVNSVLNEQNRKWKAFARMTGVTERGFEIAVQEIFPMVYTFWKLHPDKDYPLEKGIWDKERYQ